MYQQYTDQYREHNFIFFADFHRTQHLSLSTCHLLVSNALRSVRELEKSTGRREYTSCYSVYDQISPQNIQYNILRVSQYNNHLYLQNNNPYSTRSFTNNAPRSVLFMLCFPIWRPQAASNTKNMDQSVLADL